MDINSFDIEFFDFENASEEEIKEVHAILKVPANNGSVELPWEIALTENFTESTSENEKESSVEKIDPSVSVKSNKCLGSVVGPALHFTTSQAPLSPPVTQLPPPNVEAFIAPPTSVGPYPNPQYIVSRTVPYLRAYHHMGMPFFACPIPGNTGEASPLPSPYGQFVPVVSATVPQEKFIGQVDPESNKKNRPTERQYNRRSQKKSSCDYSNLETVSDNYRECLLDESSLTVSSDHPASVPIVPLPPSTFGVASGTIPLHGYPPGLHSLTYPQMTGPQAPSATMYYVPVFNHPYGSYLPSPSTPMVLPVNLHSDNPANSSCAPVDAAKTSEVASGMQSNCEESSSGMQSNCEESSSGMQSNCEESSSTEKITDFTAKHMPEGEGITITDCNFSSDYPNSKSTSSSPDCVPNQGIITDDFYSNCASSSEKQEDSARCWADLFKKPCSEVNGIDHQQRHTLDKDELYTNGSDPH